MALSTKVGKIKDVNLKLARTLQSNGKGTNKSPNHQKAKAKTRAMAKVKARERKQMGMEESSTKGR
jgi:CRISPR/Cas system Type II protein with McrA/HNH and RuvC-like nuclease domain